MFGDKKKDASFDDEDENADLVDDSDHDDNG
jgi:hypothetical protein